MVDQMVLAAQQWVNSTYETIAGYEPAPESGKTGWSTMYALTMGLQHELGISPVVDSFGPTTLATLTTKFGTIDSSITNTNVIKIIQSALYCKGYDGDAISGTWGVRTTVGLASMESNMGINVDGVVAPKTFKALLNMDAYVRTPGGEDDVREIQQWLNQHYVSRRDFYIAPADGHFSRDVQKALVFALQYELGLADGVANGSFGPTTQSLLRSQPSLSLGSQDSSHRFVHLYQAALTFNGRDYLPAGIGDGSIFTGSFGQSTADWTSEFQRFTELPITGVGNYGTWASLLVSTGDPTRQVAGLDTITRITTQIGSNLVSAGYTTVGRYLTNVNSPNALNKKIQPGELADIFAAGLRVFPIFQTYGGEASYFNSTQGAADAIAAHNAAKDYGFPKGTTIYFAVDYDAWGDDIPVNIIPHFTAIRKELIDKRGLYRMGIYAPRGVCTRVAEIVLSGIKSFVSGMSTGFSGNLGYPLPDNWAFDQIATTTAHGLTFDKVAVSGRDLGAAEVNTVPIVNMPASQYIKAIANLAEPWKAAHPGEDGSNYSTELLVAQYVAYDKYGSDIPTGIGWQLLYGVVPESWIDYVNAEISQQVTEILDPATFTMLEAAHLMATCWGYLGRGLPTDQTRVDMADMAGWGGDFITTVGDWDKHGSSYPDAYTFARETIGARAGGYSFRFNDLVEDVDGYNIAYDLAHAPSKSVGEEFDEIYAEASPTFYNWGTRFGRFYYARFGESPSNVKSAAESIFIDSDFDVTVFRAALLLSDYGSISPSDADVKAIAQAFADVIAEWADVEDNRDYL